MMTLIDDKLIKKAVIRIKGGSGPSGLDADGCRSIIVSCFGIAAKQLQNSPRSHVSQIYQITMIAHQFRLVGEALRRISRKVVIMISKQGVMKAAGSLQVCAGEEAGTEAAIHAVHDIFKYYTADAVLLIDAENAFNAVNRKAMLHISVICPVISTYISSCYNTPARLFIIGGKFYQRKGLHKDILQR